MAIEAALVGESFPAELALKHVVTPDRRSGASTGTTQTDPICLEVFAEFALARLLLDLLLDLLGGHRRHLGYDHRLFYIIAGGCRRRRRRGIIPATCCSVGGFLDEGEKNKRKKRDKHFFNLICFNLFAARAAHPMSTVIAVVVRIFFYLAQWMVPFQCTLARATEVKENCRKKK